MQACERSLTPKPNGSYFLVIHEFFMQREGAGCKTLSTLAPDLPHSSAMAW
jgi:hypothetical protein